MKIYICIKHVPDSAANIAILGDASIDENVAFLMNPYDEHGVAEAVKLKKQFPDSEIIAVCLGKKDAEKTIRSAMAMGADRGILIETAQVPDSMTAARTLKAAIAQDGTPDIIFTGKESIDSEGMQTMFRLAAGFDFPVANNVVGLEINGGRARVTYELGGGSNQVCDMALPCVIGAGRGLNTPGYPTFPDVVKARKKPVAFVPMESLAVPPAKGSARIVGLAPLVQNRTPKEIKGTPAEIAAKIVTILKEEAKVI